VKFCLLVLVRALKLPNNAKNYTDKVVPDIIKNDKGFFNIKMPLIRTEVIQGVFT